MPQFRVRTLSRVGLAVLALAAVGCTGNESSSSSSTTSPAGGGGCTGGVTVGATLTGSTTGNGQTGASFSTSASAPQAQSCDGIQAFLTETQPGFDLQSYVFFGELTASDGTQIAFSALDQSSTVGAGTSGTSESDVVVVTTNTGSGIQLSAFAGAAGSPTVLTRTANPFSARATNSSGFADVRVVEGQLGQPGAVLEFSTVNATIDAGGTAAGTTEVWVRATDTEGVGQWGYGPSGFFPQWITADQRSAITGQHGGSVGDYLQASNDPMTNQGSYYYSSGFLQVEQFTVTRDDKVVASGTEGRLIGDYVLQTFDDAAKAIVDNGVTWTEFTTRFDSAGTMKIGEVSQSSVGTLPYAVRQQQGGERLANGSLAATSWPITGIAITPDTTKTWTSPRSQKSYSTTYTVELSGDTGSGSLTYTAVYDDQEIDVAGRAVYEGLFTVTGTLDGENVSGFAWGEIQPVGTL